MALLYGNALSHSCNKLGNLDFVSKFAERIKDRDLVKTSSLLCIEQTFQFKVCKLRCNRLRWPEPIYVRVGYVFDLRFSE